MESDIRELSLYIHIPFCKKKCAYCDFLSFHGCGADRQKAYVEALCKEIEAYEPIAKEYEVISIFFGGGTPSYIDALLIEKIMQTIYSIFQVKADAEITLEGNPDSLTYEKLEIYKGMGINRLSIGLQSANDQMLETLGRVHNYNQFVQAYQDARKIGFDNINIDIMSGLPGEKAESYLATLRQVMEFNPEHISAYSLIVEEGTPLSENNALLDMLPSEEEDRELYANTKKILQQKNYGRYEISNYAKEGYECKHNIVYWTGGEYLGLGLGAASYLTVKISEKEFEHIRFHGVEQLEDYIARFSKCNEMREDSYTDMYHFYEENALLEFIRDYYKDLHFSKRKDQMEEFMFLGLRMILGISKEEFKKRFAVPIESVYGKVIEKYKERGLLKEENGRLFLSDQGIDVSNLVMAEFML